MKKALTWLALVIAVIWLVNHPTGADHLAHKTEHAIATLANGL